jgi:hypothetical protein
MIRETIIWAVAPGTTLFMEFSEMTLVTEGQEVTALLLGNTRRS